MAGPCLPNCKTNVCGDGFKSAAETCDFGTGNNTMALPTACPYNTSCMTCPMGCTGAMGAISGPTCGDGAVSTANNEECDGANLNTQTCAGLGFTGGTLTCTGCSFTTSACQLCGNNRIEPGETCEPPGSATCTATCQSVVNSCGNGALNGSETCDDGNTSTGDGCAACSIESGYSCSGAPSVCTPTCGDGVKKPQEACDLGTANNTGAVCTNDLMAPVYEEFCVACSSSCTPVVANGGYCGEPAPVCQAASGESATTCPSDCPAVCGDGARTHSEPCDGGDFGAATCSNQTAGTKPNGSLTCTSCAIVTTGCTP